ncbi:hypothetical protein CRYUN_Cryun24cG0019700 [Craigia yunnanensis]
MAPLFPSRNPSFRPCLLLVLHLLPFSFSPHVPYNLHNLPNPKINLFSPFQQLHIDDHDISMARVFTVVSGFGDPVHDPGLLCGLWLSILDGNRVTKRLLSIRFDLPNSVVRLQPGLPCWGFDLAFHERWVQWDWSLDFELGFEWGYFVTVSEVLCSEQKKTWETN